ncbi:MAG: hypothetical protein QG549_100 [Patescibacteria group bacterium]|nr:hypothetical protein [Patescibacteria group bacterium]
MTNIPKKIHYCWFGGNPLTPLAKDCIASWKKYCPDYEIIEWNETNIDINSSPFMKAAYENKKWAFVSDYARYKVIYEEGGVYLDVDVEVIKNLDDLLKHDAYIGFEGREYVNSGLGFGAKSGDKTLKEILSVYDNTDYLKHKDNPAEISTPIIVTNILLKHGFQQNGELQKVGTMTILPEDYLCPKNPITRLTNITPNSHSIHHYDASWVDSEERKYIDKLEEDSKSVAARFPDLISIIIPVYNGEDYLALAIESAINQTYKNLEVIVVDDGSSDRTEEIARSFGPRIKYIRKSNGGVSSALNIGINSMRGKYFAWLSHDDVYHVKKLEELHRSLKGQDNKTIAISDWDIIDQNGAFLKHSKLDNRLEKTPMSFLAFDRKTWLNACAMLIPKSLFEEAGLFNESLRTTQDYDMFFRMIKRGASFKIHRTPLFYSRHHLQQGSLAVGDDTLSNSDQIHTDIISKLSQADLDAYFGGSFEEVDKVYQSFVSNGYSITPVAITQKLLEVYGIAYPMVDQFIRQNLVSIGGTVEEEVINDFTKTMKAKKSKPRLLFCSGPWLTGGMERVLSNLFQHLSDRYDILLITPSNGAEQRATIPIPSNVTHLKLSRDLYRDSFDIVALTHAKLLNVDVVIGFLNLNEKQLKLYEGCVRHGIKTIASNHEYYFFPHRSPDPGMRRFVARRKEVFKKLDAVLWLTNFSTAVHDIDADNGYLMPNPNTFEIEKRSANKTGTKNIICVGRFNDHIKRVDRIINVFGRVQKEIPDSTLTLVGTVDRDAPTADVKGRSIDELIRKANISFDNVIFAGETSDISSHYKKADLILLTSETEGFPMVLTEAMCHGLPVVCGDIPGIEDIVIDGENGFVVEQNDSATMAQRVSEILANSTLRDTMSKSALSHAAQFSGQNIAKRWDSLLKAVIRNDNTSVALKEVLSFNIPDRDVFERRIIKEIDESVRQSIVMADSLAGVNKEKAHLKALRLARAAKRDYATLGVRRASKKTLKKVTRKVANVLRLDRS